MNAAPEPRLIRLTRTAHACGWSETCWSERHLASLGLATSFVEDALEHAAAPLTLRGLHWQRPPHAQARLLRAVAGRAMAVAIDLRRGAAGFRRHVAHVLDAKTASAFYVPEGFALGTLTLLPDTLLLTKLSAPSLPSARAGLRWNDPALGVLWPLAGATPVMEAADRALPRLAEIGEALAA